MEKVLFSVVAFLLLSCNQNVVSTDSDKIDKAEIELLQVGNEASIKINSENNEFQRVLNLEPPCYFLRKEGKVQSFSYPDQNIDNVFIIIGDIASAEDKNLHSVSNSKICGKKIQGIVIKGKDAFISKEIISGSISCKDNGLDEKDFWTFAHSELDNLN